MLQKVYNSAVELSPPLFRRKRKRSNTGLCSTVGVRLSFPIVGRRYSAGSSCRFSPFFSDHFERRGLVYVGADIDNAAQMQATNGSGYWQSHGCVPAQGSGRGYTSENARFEDTHFQSGTDLVGADWEPTLSVANGQPVSQTDALNNTTSYTYNSLGKVLTVTDAEYNVTSYTYNLLGQMTSLTDPEGNATSWTYDSMGRVVTETNEKNAVRSYEYDDLGRLIQTTDRNGRVIQYEYDYLGRQTAEKWLDSNNAVIGSILYTFDRNNNLLTVTDSISGTDYEYRYDALNRCVYTCIDAAELNSPVYLSYLYNDSALTVTETLTGLINGIVAPYYQNVYQYDVFGRLESISQTGTGLTAKSVDYVYNLNGQRIRAEYQQNGIAVSESNWVYDVTGKVSSIQHKTALDAVFAEYDFTWDAGNRIIEIDSTDGTAEYAYDKTGQLTGADYDYITDELYTYDDNGNRTNAGYVTGDNNETLSDGTYRYSYDAEGNRTEKFLWTDTNNDGIIDASEKTLFQTYEWDYRNRLSSVTNYENGIAKEIIDYLYDYLNLMIERTVTDAETSILQSSDFNIYSNGQIILEYDTTSSVDVVKSINLWGANIDELVAVEQIVQSVSDNNIVLWSYGDHLNSIRDIVLYDSITQTAAVVNHLVYNAFGILVSSTDGAANPVSISPLLNYRYTGKFFDDSTGLQNNVNRWYDNTTGKWLSVDPISFDGSDPNLYRYVGNYINTFIDYNGQVWGWAIGAGIGGAIGFATAMWHGLSWSEVAGATVAGATAGAIAGALIDPTTSLAATVAISAGAGAAGEAAGSVTTQTIDFATKGKPFDTNKLVSDTISGAEGGAIGGGAGYAISKVVPSTVNMITRRTTRSKIAPESVSEVTSNTSKTAQSVQQTIEASEIAPKTPVPKPMSPKQNTCPTKPVTKQPAPCFIGSTQVLTSSIYSTANAQQDIPFSIYVKYGIIIISCGILLPYIQNQLKLRKKAEIPIQATCN